MYKLIIINTHNVTEINGTQISVLATLNQINDTENFIAAYLYDEHGVMIKAKQSFT